MGAPRPKTAEDVLVEDTEAVAHAVIAMEHFGVSRKEALTIVLLTCNINGQSMLANNARSFLGIK
jgi:hypothetical protein